MEDNATYSMQLLMFSCLFLLSYNISGEIYYIVGSLIVFVFWFILNVITLFSKNKREDN